MKAPLTMSALQVIRRQKIQISNATALNCNSCSGDRPALTMDQVQSKAARAIAFCLQNRLEPTTTRLRKLSGLKTIQLHNYFNNIEHLKYEMTVRYKLQHIGFTETNSLVPLNGYANRVFYWRRQYGVLNPEINLDPSQYSFQPLELVLGFSGYSLFKKNVPVRYKGLEEITELFSVLCAIELKRSKFIHHATGMSKAIGLGKAVAHIVRAMAYSDGKIYHDESFLRYIQAYDKDNRIIHKDENYKSNGLFHRKNGTGNVHRGSYRYLLTRKGEAFMVNVIESFVGLVLDTSKILVHKADLLIDINSINDFNIRDRFILLSRCLGAIDGKLHISNFIKDNNVTRVYGLMTMLTSPARTTMGYKQYDMAAALQSIVVDQLEVNGINVEESYPAHYALVRDRKSYRTKIMEETGKDETWAKKKLTSIDNGGTVGEGYLHRSPSLKAYKDEANNFAMDYLDAIPIDQLFRAQDLTWVPKDLDEYWVQKEIKKGKRFEDGRKKFGVFFHAWTQTERYLRDLMKLHFKEYCHDVHDAIATKETVDVALINQTLQDAGFNYVKVAV